MKRRTVLAGVCGLSGPLAGCALPQSSSRDQSHIPRSADEFPIHTDGFHEVESWDFDEKEPYRTIEIGSGERLDDRFEPHDIYIWNTLTARDVDVRIIDMWERTVVSRETYSLPDDAMLSITLRDPAVYLLDLYVPATETQQVLRVPCDSFDCNITSTRVALEADGRLGATGRTTLALCPNPICEPSGSGRETERDTLRTRFRSNHRHATPLELDR